MPLKIYTVAQVADLLTISKHSVYGLIKKGKLKAAKISTRRVRILESDVLSFIAKSMTESSQKIRKY